MFGGAAEEEEGAETAVAAEAAKAAAHAEAEDAETVAAQDEAMYRGGIERALSSGKTPQELLENVRRAE